MVSKLATLTLQILRRGHKTTHWDRSLWLDLSYRTWYQCSSSLRKSQRDNWIKPRHILDARDRNEVDDPNHTLLATIEKLMELVAARKYWSKIDLVDRYYNLRIEEDLEQPSIFPNTYGILPQSHYAMRCPQYYYHHGTSYVRNL